MNKNGEFKCPKRGDILLFICQTADAQDGQLIYEACGFPNFTLDDRAMLDISTSFTLDNMPTCIIGSVTRMEVSQERSSKNGHSSGGLIYIDVKRTFD